MANGAVVPALRVKILRLDETEHDSVISVCNLLGRRVETKLLFVPIGGRPGPLELSEVFVSA